MGVPERSRTARVRLRLAAWWEANARDLPWRFGRATPWGILVSEVMSQQTQMSRVVPYWTAWMERWPDAAALAAAPKSDVIGAWGRLGYPRRALRLQECARVVAGACGDELPRTYDALVALPGVGDYTASAVMSFAYGERIAVVDTNIRRVLSRVFAGEESRGGAASAAERALAAAVLPGDDGSDGAGSDDDDDVPRDVSRDSGDVPHDVSRDGSRIPSVMWNQSVMELGALVCTAKNPLCGHCPVRDDCAFLAAGRPGLGERRTRPRQRFRGTDRQVRGIVLDALRGLPAASEQSAGRASVLERATVETLWKDHAQLDRCVASLDEDGLIEILPGGAIRLPR
ncbi:A/G-specific adenine glycosylase [Bifidobacterium parmae]|nr:A/G-specific adenine glycosylase [Bifidobacterium parmae]